MAEYIRKAFMIPRKVREALDGQFSAEIQLEVIYAIDDYARYWDIYRCDDGFDVQHLSPLAKMAFMMVLSEVREHNANYIQRCETNATNAIAGVEKRQEKEIKNAKRRRKYALNKQKTSCQRKNLSLGGVTKSVTKVDNETLPGNGLQGSERSPIGLLVTGNSTHVKLPVVTEEKRCGEKHLIHKSAGDKLANNDPTSGLSGSNLKVCAMDKAECRTVKGNKGGGSKAISSKGAVGIGRCVPVVKDNAAVNNKLGKDGLCRNHVPDGEIVIAANFHIDFLDPVFAQYNRADDFLKKGVEDWMIEHKLGRSVEKKWIAKQIWKFACNQGKANLLLGIEEDEE